MEEYSQEIVDNIKHEPEVHFTCYLPEYPESDEEPEVQEVKIVLQKFDKKWKSSAKLFKSYFVCGKCEYANKYSGEVVRHLKVCKTPKKCKTCCLRSKSEKIIECIFCDTQFNCNNCRSIHIPQVHRKGSSWHCSKCEFKTPKKEYLRQHYPIHDKKFSCQTCEQKFSHKQLLTNHQQQHRHGEYTTGPKIQFSCRTCVRSFATKKGLGHHETYVHSKLNYHCDVCGKTTKTKHFLRIHMQIHQKVPCPFCHHLFTEHRLQDHIEMHTTNPSFMCDACDKVYFNQNDLNSHKNRKHEIKQVQCDLCQKIFKNKLLLRNHMNCHLMVSCPTCSISMSKHNLSQHRKTHSSKQESLACAIKNCRQKFSCLEEFDEHKQIHIGTKIYKCPSCNHQSKTLQSTKIHMKCHQA